MAQTTGQVPQACGMIEISTDCVTYTDVSGVFQSVQDTTQARKSGEAYTFEGDKAIVAAGKREPMELTFVIVYTETDAEAYEIIRTRFEIACGGKLCVRYTPRGSGEGKEQITTDEGIITSFTYPPMDASAGGPIMAGFKLKAGGVTTTVKAS